MRLIFVYIDTKLGAALADAFSDVSCAEVVEVDICKVELSLIHI